MHLIYLWYISDLGDGFNKISNKNSGNVIDVRAKGMNNDDQVVQYEWYDGDNQKWRFEPVESIGLPSIGTFPRPDVPEYEYEGQDLPIQTDPVVTNYTLAPCIAVGDKHFNEQEKVKYNPYYLF